MPELPEVETTRRGLAPHLPGRSVTHVIVREPRLRWPVPEDLAATLTGIKMDLSATRDALLAYWRHIDAGGCLTFEVIQRRLEDQFLILGLDAGFPGDCGVVSHAATLLILDRMVKSG